MTNYVDKFIQSVLKTDIKIFHDRFLNVVFCSNLHDNDCCFPSVYLINGHFLDLQTTTNAIFITPFATSCNE